MPRPTCLAAAVVCVIPAPCLAGASSCRGCDTAPTEPPVVSRNTSHGSPSTTQRHTIESSGCGQVLSVVGRIAWKEAVPRPACDAKEHRQQLLAPEQAYPP